MDNLRRAHNRLDHAMLRPLSDPCQTRMRWQPLVTGLIVSILIWLLIWVLLLMVSLASAADGLPEELPDLYDPGVIASFPQIERRPVHWSACRCGTTLLTSATAHSAKWKTVVPTVRVIGFLTEQQYYRIVIIVETFYHLDGSGLRSLRVWLDKDWMSEKIPYGHWSSPSGGTLSEPMTKEKATVVMDELRGRIQGRSGQP